MSESPTPINLQFGFDEEGQLTFSMPATFFNLIRHAIDTNAVSFGESRTEIRIDASRDSLQGVSVTVAIEEPPCRPGDQ